MSGVNQAKGVVLVGGGGHCRACIDVVEQCSGYEIEGIVGTEKEIGQSILGYSINYVDEDLARIKNDNNSFLIVVGQIKSNRVRVELFKKIQNIGGRFATVISARAYVSRFAKIDDGTIVMHDALVNSNSLVGVNCILNSRSLVEHDAQIGDHCHISTGAIINGGACIGDGCFVGSGAIVHQNVNVEANSVVGSNSTISRDVPSGTTIRSGTTH